MNDILNIQMDQDKGYSTLSFQLGDETKCLYGHIANDIHAIITDYISRHAVILDRPKGSIQEYRDFVKSFLSEEVEYAEINNLSGVENKHNVKWARKLLAGTNND